MKLQLLSDESIIYICGIFAGIFLIATLDIENRFYSMLAGVGVLVFYYWAYRLWIYSKKWAQPSVKDRKELK